MQKLRTSPTFGTGSDITADGALYVIKRDGTKQSVKFDKITVRLQKLADMDRQLKVNVELVAQQVIKGITPGITTTALDKYAADVAADMTNIHPDYAELSGRIKVSDLHKTMRPTFSAAMEMAYSENYNHFLKKNQPLISDEFIQFVRKHKDALDAAIDLNADYTYNAFACNTLFSSYCLKTREGQQVESIQYTWMREAIGTSNYDLDRALKTYKYLNGKYATHATPTIFNAGTPKPQLSSCFLLTMKADSIEGIYETLKRCALLSQGAGGIGLNISDIRASGSYIAGTGGFSNGLKPMMRVFNDTAKYVDQCFLGHTLVLTSTGYVPIKSIKEGDYVFTSNGSFERVSKARKYDFSIATDPLAPKDLRVIEVAHSAMPAVCTEKHPFYTLRSPAGLKFDNASHENVADLINKKLIAAEWIEADNLCLGDLIAVPLPAWNSELTLMPSKEECYQYGLSVARQQDGVQGTFNRHFTHIEGDHISHLFQGLTSTIFNGYYWVENCSHAFALHLSQLILKRGYLPRHKDVNQLTTSIGFPAALLQRQGYTEVFVHNDIAWVPVTRLSLAFSSSCADDEILTVYDLDVDNHHNFLTNAGLVHNGGGKRKGSFALYLEPWHADIEVFLEQKQNKKTVKSVAKDDGVSSPDLFYGLWMPDLFYKRVISNGTWSTFCPNEAPGLTDCFGEEFERKYEEYEKVPGLARKVYKAQDLFKRIVTNQIETGTPYMVNKDHSNRKSNQQNLGTIKCSNLCTEIILYTSPDEVAVCNLCSFSLPAFFNPNLPGKFDHDLFFEVVSHFTGNLDNVIDINHYPIPQAEYSNKKHRPTGLGVQGFADLLFLSKLPYDSEESAKLNEQIFETLYFAALSTSCERARLYGKYSSYEGSPMSKGILQFDMWGKKPTSGRWDWDGLRKKIDEHGVRNSVLVAPMPTASTSIVMDNIESFEPQNSNIFSRNTLAGTHQVVNKYLVKDLIELGLWNEETRNMIIADNGSIQKIDSIPQELKDIYKTVWEIKQRVVLDMAADRGKYIDQSMSLNIHMPDPTPGKMYALHLYAWQLGLKTGMYYCRTPGKAQAQKFTVDPKYQKSKDQIKTEEEPVASVDVEEDDGPVCTMQEGCITCSS